MWQFLGIIIAIAMLITAFKFAIGLLFLAGLIFRTKETVGLILFLGILALFNKYTAFSLVLIGVAVVVGLVRWLARTSDRPELIDGAGD